MTKKKNNWYSNHKKPVLICGLVVLVLLIVYLAGMLYYNDKFLMEQWSMGVMLEE